MSFKGGIIKIHNRLWLARKRRGLGQKQVAFLIDKTIDEISRYERGVRLPELATALAIEVVYGAPLRVLFKDLYQQVLEEVNERMANRDSVKAVYTGLLAEKDLLSAMEYCSYVDMLRGPHLSQPERDRVREHVTWLAKQLVSIQE